MKGKQYQKVIYFVFSFFQKKSRIIFYFFLRLLSRIIMMRLRGGKNDAAPALTLFYGPCIANSKTYTAVPGMHMLWWSPPPEG
jgi:hypothetical protein